MKAPLKTPVKVIRACIIDAKGSHGNAETFAEIAINAHDKLVHLLRHIINDLPQRRDWLDPDIEREARALLFGLDKEMEI